MAGRPKDRPSGHQSAKVKEVARNACLSIWNVSIAEFDRLCPPKRGKRYWRILERIAVRHRDWTTAKHLLDSARETRIATAGKSNFPRFIMSGIETVWYKAQRDEDDSVAGPTLFHDDDEEMPDAKISVDDSDEADGGGMSKNGERQAHSEMEDGTPVVQNATLGQGAPIEHGEAPRSSPAIPSIHRDWYSSFICWLIKTVSSAYPLSVCVVNPAILTGTSTAAVTSATRLILVPIYFGNTMNDRHWSVAMVSPERTTIEIYDTMDVDIYDDAVHNEIGGMLAKLRKACHPYLESMCPEDELEDETISFHLCVKNYNKDLEGFILFAAAAHVMAGKEVPTKINVGSWAWVACKYNNFCGAAEAIFKHSSLANLDPPEPPRPNPVDNDKEERARHDRWLKEMAEWRDKRKPACKVAHGILDVLEALKPQTERSQVESLLTATRTMMVQEDRFTGDPDHGRSKLTLQRRISRLEQQLENANKAVGRLEACRQVLQQLLDGKA